MFFSLLRCEIPKTKEIVIYCE